MNKDDIAAAKEEIMTAVEYTGGLHCHECGEGPNRHKVTVRRSSAGNPYVKCWKCSWHADAITLVQEATGATFTEAVNQLLGRDTRDDFWSQPRQKVDIPQRFQADLDEFNVKVYNTLIDLDTPGIACAADVWHADHGINPEVARDYRATRVQNAVRLRAFLEHRFGYQRVEKAGLTSERGRVLFEGDYTLIEAHVAPSGNVFCVQFRATGETAAAAKEHKRTKGTPEATRFVPHVLAIRGSSPKHLIGCGLEKIRQAPEGSVVHVVEGYKDMLAAAELGMLPYALPGASTNPPEDVVKVFARRNHPIVLALDNDAAGRAGADQLETFFADHGIATTRQFPAEGCDWADMLASNQPDTPAVATATA